MLKFEEAIVQNMNNYRELIFLKELNGVGPARINKIYIPLLLNGIELDSLISFVRENEVKVDDNNIQEALSRSDNMVKTVGGRSDIGIITILDTEYPSKLRALGNNAPIILYTKCLSSNYDDNNDLCINISINSSL